MKEATQYLQGKTVLISAGGTGGHVYPALTVAGANIKLHTIFVQGLRGNGIKRLLKAPLTLLSAAYQARRVLKTVSPDIFVGFGGFASGPGAMAAKLAGVPVVVHEQNAAMGLTNKIVSRWAKRVLLAFPITGRPSKVGEVVGNPIRPSIAAIAAPAQRRQPAPPFKVLVVGGSLGAKAINDVVPQALTPLLDRITLTHQTGKTTFAETRAEYEKRGLLETVKVCEYIDDMDKAYAEADLLIARAGALTVSEIASVGVAAIFVPLPHAVDNHQFLNAKFLADNDAAVIIEQKELSAAHLREVVTALLTPEKLRSMAENARQQSHADALPAIIKTITGVLYDRDKNHH
ncbi:MAG: undecaprenyldiphospho-muramoylpentapeptide beta-N-acetylglucosaminyltransferase [Gammaproteobacteria bacterium]|nr:MAG: undecaprenyldiphospho-muramoylpentapeptide beta-N-acetylglucosaminyltransferase [Gammaproteobacteria bacterium]